MSDRLKELQRQRALAQEQLAWFDREIAKESGQAPAGPVATPVPVIQRVMSANTFTAADEILAQYAKPGTATEKDVKRGCMLYFILALSLLALGTATAYLIYINTRR